METIRQLYRETNKFTDKEITLSGWIRNNRGQKAFGFIDLHDGSFFKTVQVVYESEFLENFQDVQKFRVGSSVEVKGLLIETPNSKQPFELKAREVALLGSSDEDFPIQPKRHTKEFLREVAHLRPRTNLFNAVFRVRSLIAHAIHSFFQDQDFVYVHTPIITGNDGEGAGEMFRVTTMDVNDVPRTEEGEVNYREDFFQIPANLTVTGQLHVESFIPAFRNCYTFGPTFRSENSNTKKHGAEFWMIEPEISFGDIQDNMDLAEDMIKYVIKYILDKAPEEMEFFNKFVEKGLLDKLKKATDNKFSKVTHKEAIDILLESMTKGQKFENLPKQGEDLATEHEKFLVEHFGGPVYVIDWPKDIKAFYMRMNDDGETVAAMDLLVPGSGELVGGSQREERLDVLEARMDELGVPKEELEWYLDLRRYGGTIHSGFGIGFERLVMYVTGVDNIRDVLPFPRTVKNCKY